MRVSNPSKLIVDGFFLTRCRISVCQGLGPNKHDEILEIDHKYVTLHSIVLHYVIVYHSIGYHMLLYYVTLYHVILYIILSYHIILYDI